MTIYPQEKRKITEETEFGFRFGSATIERVCHDKNKGEISKSLQNVKTFGE
jgi:hypothetical protein